MTDGPGSASELIRPDGSRRRRARPPSGDTLVGTRIGDCEVRRKLAEGGSADIYLARHHGTGEQRVLKILKLSLVANREFHKRFEREAQLSSRLQHPNVLRVLNTGTVGRVFYIEMEYVDGESLRTVLSREKKLEEKRALQIASDIAEALTYAHSVTMPSPDGRTITGILHRDIKPENIMILANGSAALMDFGAARPMGVESTTTVGTIVGTFQYMAPEQLRGGDLSTRTDFFSLGIVMYEMLTGTHPFDTADLALLLENIRRGDHVAVRERSRDISPATGALVEALLASDPGKRPRDAGEIVDRLSRAQAKLKKYHPGRGGLFLRIALWVLTALTGLLTAWMAARALL